MLVRRVHFVTSAVVVLICFTYSSSCVWSSPRHTLETNASPRTSEQDILNSSSSTKAQAKDNQTANCEGNTDTIVINININELRPYDGFLHGGSDYNR